MRSLIPKRHGCRQGGWAEKMKSSNEGQTHPCALIRIPTTLSLSRSLSISLSPSLSLSIYIYIYIFISIYMYICIDIYIIAYYSCTSYIVGHFATLFLVSKVYLYCCSTSARVGGDPPPRSRHQTPSRHMPWLPMAWTKRASARHIIHIHISIILKLYSEMCWICVWHLSVYLFFANMCL